MLEELEAIHSDSISAIAEIADTDGLEAFRVACLGRKGRLTLIAAQLKDIPKEDKPAAGKALNKVRGAITAAMSEKGESLQIAFLFCLPQKNMSGRTFGIDSEYRTTRKVVPLTDVSAGMINGGISHRIINAIDNRDTVGLRCKYA